MPARTFHGGYRFGFNGKEQDPETSGQGNQYDYGFRIYNPRLGKFLSVDPLTKKFPWWSPYQFSGNNPVKYIDLDGLEAVDPSTGKVVDEWGSNGKTATNDKKPDGNSYFEHFTGIKPEDITFQKEEKNKISVFDKDHNNIGSFQYDKPSLLSSFKPGTQFGYNTLSAVADLDNNSNTGWTFIDGSNSKGAESGPYKATGGAVVNPFMRTLLGTLKSDGNSKLAETPYNWDDKPTTDKIFVQRDALSTYLDVKNYRDIIQENIEHGAKGGPDVSKIQEPKVDQAARNWVSSDNSNMKVGE